MLEGYFPAFMAFFFPTANADIDWSRGYESLDTELAQIIRDAALGRRLADKLVKVWRRDGAEQVVIIHTEIQGERAPEFANACMCTTTGSLTAMTARWSAWRCWATPVHGGGPHAMAIICGAVVSGSHFR